VISSANRRLSERLGVPIYASQIPPSGELKLHERGVELIVGDTLVDYGPKYSTEIETRLRVYAVSGYGIMYRTSFNIAAWSKFPRLYRWRVNRAIRIALRMVV